MAKSILDYGMGPLRKPPSTSNGRPGGGILVAPPSSAGSSSGLSVVAKPQNNGGSNVVKPPSGLVGTGGGLAGMPTTYTGLSGEKKSGVFSGSASGVGVNSGTQQQIKDQMNANSEAWHKATSQAEKDWLHKENQRLSGELGGSVAGNFNPDSGTWGGTAGRDYFAEAEERLKRERARIQAEQEAAARAKVEQAVGGLNAQKGTVEQSYSDLFRQLYLDRRRAEKNLPQQMAAMGYTGGLVESSALNLQTGYRDALRQGEQQRVTTLSDIDRAITDARLTGDISIAEQAAQLAQQGLASYTDLVKNQQAQSNWQKEFTYQQAQDAQEWKYRLQSMNRQEQLDQLSRSDIDYNRKLEAAQYLYEKTGDANGLSVLGYTPEQLGALGQRYEVAGRSAELSNNNATSPQGGQTYTDLLTDRFNNGEVSNEVIIGLRDAGYTKDELVQSGYNPGLHSIMNELTELEDTRNPGTQIYNAIMRYNKNGMLTEAEAAALLKQYGLGGNL